MRPAGKYVRNSFLNALLLIDQPVTTFSKIWLPGEGTNSVAT